MLLIAQLSPHFEERSASKTETGLYRLHSRFKDVMVQLRFRVLTHFAQSLV